MGLPTVGRTTLALAVITVVVTGENRFGVDRVGNGLAKAVSSESHIGYGSIRIV